jgi:type IV pilus assembly protein PilB
MTERLGDILVRRKILDSAQLQACLEEQNRTNKFLGEILVQRQFVTERQLLEILAEQFQTRFVSLADLKIGPVVINLVPKELVFEHKFMPLAMQSAVILIAVSNPLDMWPMSVLQSKLDLAEVRFVLAEKADIENAIKKHYGAEAA